MFCLGDALSFYDKWEDPVVIMSDGPYGFSGYAGDLKDADGLASWYEPHVKIWSERASPFTTLWFWNTELGWAETHSLLKQYGWEYKCCCIWDKGIAHIAGNINTQTLTKFPVVTEVCVQYTRKPEFKLKSGSVSAQEWLRTEWERTGLSFQEANLACEVKNAATRKYLTKDHVWYFPPADVFEKLVEYANLHGVDSGKPYFAIDGNVLKASQWERLRAKFYCPFGETNVWRSPALHGKARHKLEGKTAHPNQKPYELIKRIVLASSDEGDAIWEPFGGLCPAYLVSLNSKRTPYASEINKEVYQISLSLIKDLKQEQSLFNGG